MTESEREEIIKTLKVVRLYDDSNFTYENRFLEKLKTEGWTNIQIFQLVMDSHHIPVTSYHTKGLFKMSYHEYLKHDPYKEKGGILC